MRFGRISRGAAIASLAAASWVTVSASAPAQESAPRGETKAASAKPSDGKERASGVIIKVDEVKARTASDSPKGGDTTSAASLRLTINTNAVWRDWARDQSQATDTKSAKRDAAKGRNSVATVGEPVDPDSLLVVVVNSDVRVETRFRAPDDETSKGASTPPKDKTATRTDAHAKTVEFAVKDLKPGLFVEVDFRTVKSLNVAKTVTVIRPVGGPDSGSADTPRPVSGEK